MKQTEIGMIPDDWEQKNILDVLIASKDKLKIGPFGSQLKKEYLLDLGQYKVFGQENVYSHDFNYCYRFLTKEHFQKLQSCELKTGDFVISTMGTIGKCEVVPNDSGIGIMDSHLVRLRLDNSINKHYFKYFFQSEIIQNQIKALSVGGIMDGLSTSIIKKLNVLSFDINEQQKIAKALSDVDNVISTLEKLITKKKNLKQGTMQQLLTGKKRLPGFAKSNKFKQTEIGEIPEDWEVRELGDVTKIVMGQSPKSSCYNTNQKGLVLIQGNADIENRKTIVRFYTSHITKVAAQNDLILTVRAPVGNIAKATFDCCLGRGVCALKNHSEYLYQYLLFIEDSWSKTSTGSTFDSINYANLAKTKIICPNNESEQTAIANVLSSMDKEIEALNTKLEKYRNLKTGMMQQLLTGKIRLI